jgi:hypothetical protein
MIAVESHSGLMAPEPALCLAAWRPDASPRASLPWRRCSWLGRHGRSHCRRSRHIHHVQAQREQQVRSERNHGHDGERIADAAAEDSIGSAAARSSEGSCQAAALGPLDQNDQDHHRRDDEKDDCQNQKPRCSFVYCLCGHSLL